MLQAAPAQPPGELHQDLFLSNFPLNRSVGAILTALSAHIYRNFGAYPHYIEKRIVWDGIHIAVDNTMQYEAIKQCNGCYIFNQPIWIIEYPAHFGEHMEILSQIFEICTSNGIVDLSLLQVKYQEVEGLDSFKKPLRDGQTRRSLASEVNFANPAFVEFLLYRLGSEARDKRFFVETLILSDNNIRSLASLEPYMVFLPTLRFLVLMGNTIQDRNDITIPRVQCIFDSYMSTTVTTTQYTENTDLTWDLSTELTTESTTESMPTNAIVRDIPETHIVEQRTLSSAEAQAFSERMKSAPVIQ